MFEVGTFIFSIIMFLIMFWLVSRFGFKPIQKMLEQRRLHIETQIQEAESGRMEANRILAEQHRLLEDARKEAKNLLDVARARTEEQARKMMQDAQAEAERVLAEGRNLIERERAEAMNEVMTKVANLTVELTTKLLEGHVTAEVNQTLLSEAEQRVGELVW